MLPNPAVAERRAAAPRPGAWHRLLLQEDLNFLLTNRIPRRLATRFCGWFSQLRTGRFTRLTIGLWRLFAPDLDLSESRQQQFCSLHECFIRELRAGVRPIDPRPDVMVSPCDAIVGAHGRIEGCRVYQAKGFPYSLQDLLGDPALVDRFADGSYVTLRLKSSFYHRFHAPCHGTLQRVVYRSGDTWNVNPIALKRIEALFTKNERAVLQIQPEQAAESIAIVAVAAILVASIRLHCLGTDFDLRRQGNRPLVVDAPCAKGQELGWFQHGSTLLVFATRGYGLLPSLREGERIRMGEPLLHRIDPHPIPATDSGTETR